MSIHILYRSIDGRPEDCLGAVIDADSLAELQTTEAMPFGGFLKEAADYVIDAAMGDVIASIDGKFVRAPVFDRKAWEAQQASDDAFALSASPEQRKRLKLDVDHVSEVERKAQRKADAEAQAAKMAAERKAAEDAEAAAEAMYDAAIEKAAARMVAAQEAAKGKP